jgi:hypothetical protein
VQRIGEHRDFVGLAAGASQLRTDRIDMIRRPGLLAHAREHGPAVRDLRRAPVAAQDFGLGFIEAPEIRQDLRARDQRGREIRICATRFVEQRERARLFVEVTELRRRGQQHRDRDVRQRAQMVDGLVHLGHGVERAQAREHLPQHRGIARARALCLQGVFARGAIVAGERMRVGQVQQHIGIVRVRGLEPFVGGDRLREFPARDVQVGLLAQALFFLRQHQSGSPCDARRARSGSSCVA